MPAQELSFRKQYAVVWPALGYDSYGQATVSDTPSELLVRWNDVQNEVLDVHGNTITLDATAVVDRKIPIGSLLWLGRLGDWQSLTVLAEQQWRGDLLEVKTFNETLDLKERKAFRTVGLMRYKGKLPASAGEG